MKMADGVAASAVIRFSTWAEIHVGLVGLVVFRSYNTDDYNVQTILPKMEKVTR